MHSAARELATFFRDLTIVRAAQEQWRQTPWPQRIAPFRRLRHALADHAESLAKSAAAVERRPIGEKLMAEVLPLADACHWLTRHAPRVLAPRRVGSFGNPLWLRGVSSEVQRQPFGVVLVIGPGNYPLFLPAVQTLQALVAGNAVLLKPAPGTSEVMVRFTELLRVAGLAAELFTILPESVEAAHEVIREGVDKVIFTGSWSNGRDVLGRLAPQGTPSVMELSGEDAVLVLADADLDLVAAALRFGLRSNNGKTCIAPRRLLVAEAVAVPLLARIAEEDWVRLQIVRVTDDEAALAEANANPFGLGASIFSRDLTRARSLAARLQSGCVTINDLIVPTADPRLPFTGTKSSGFGSTRGREGLLEMTYPHVVATRFGKSRRHFAATQPGDEKIFGAYIRTRHGRHRLAALRSLLRALRRRKES